MNDERGHVFDLDVYCARDNYVEVLDFLTNVEGYNLYLTTDDLPDDTRTLYRLNSGINDVFRLERGASNIDVVVSVNESSLFPILFFNCTGSMNALSPTDFYSFYYDLTVQRRSLLSDTSFRSSDVGGVEYGYRLPAEKASALVRKYRRRGFTISDLPLGSMCSHPMECRNRTCRLTRYSDDGQSLHIVFGGTPVLQRTIRWCLGGYPCGAENNPALYHRFKVELHDQPASG